MIPRHEFWWRFLPKRELTQVYLSGALRSFAISMIGLFIPLYLYTEQGFSLQQTLLFFVFYAVIFAIATPVAAKFVARYGPKHAILVSVPVYLLFFGLLYALYFISVPLYIIAAMLGVSQAFYWLGLHLVFHHASDRKHRGEEVGIQKSSSIVAGMFGPIIGGVSIATVGFDLVFIIAGFFLLLSAVVLLQSDEEHVSYRFSVRSVLNKEHWRNSLFFVSSGTQVIASGVIWPLFIFFILGSYVALGLVGSLISGISALLLWLAGKYSDHRGKRRIIRWTIGFESISWFLKAFTTTVPHVFGVTIFGAITDGIIASPIGALEYNKAQGEIASYFVSREIFICLGRILLLVFVLMIDSLSGGLIFQGIASLGVLLF
ncbi:MFS transporter [Candidatus Woesearchaeota archaeon]|nr:MFS transporter [Candidatus Woesearchaeota archaeon]